jgi:hypothetical protein
MPPRLWMPARERAVWYQREALSSIKGRAGSLCAQQLQHIRGQRNVAILGALALLDAHAHAVAVAVDVPHPQPTQLAHPQSQPVGGHEHRARLAFTSACEQTRELFARQDLRQPLLGLRQRYLDLLRALQHRVVQKPERTTGLVHAGACQAPLARQVQQVGLHLRSIQLVRTAVIVSCQSHNGTHIGLLGPLGQPAQLHRIDHPLAQRCHRRSP